MGYSRSDKGTILTNKMIPFKITCDSIPTLRSSKLNLSNFSGESLLRILKNKIKMKSELINASSDSTHLSR